MISDTIFVQQSLINNLFYLRTLKEYALNIELSFFGNNQELINAARDFREKYENLLERAINLSQDSLVPILFNSQLFVTDYTLEVEKLTEKLFGIEIDTSLTERQQNQISDDSIMLNQDIINELMRLNREASNLSQNFLDFLEYILGKMKSKELFSYSYPAFYQYMILETTLFVSELERLISKSSVEPTYIVGFQFGELQGMKNQAQFIKGLSDPKQLGIIRQAESFEKQFSDLLEKYQSVKLSPDVQKVLNEEALDVTERFQAFVSSIIERILNEELYFIIEPLFFDNLLTDINYFIYLLRGSDIGIQK